MTLRLALLGIGKIARDQHIPTIAASPDFELVAAVSRHGAADGVPNYPTLKALLDSGTSFDAIGMCQPPQARFEAAMEALGAGLHVLLEKPPGATLAETAILADLAAEKGVTLYASWHSRFAAGVPAAARWLADKTVSSASVIWKEDVRRWHPGQTWIWQPGGLGVFDPGINAISIVTDILPRPFYLKTSALSVPVNTATPIAADLLFHDTAGAPVTFAFDFLQQGEQTWQIEIVTTGGTLLLTEGGAKLAIDGVAQPVAEQTEYAGVYQRFADLIKGRRSEVDVRPLQHAADACLNGSVTQVEAFIE